MTEGAVRRRVKSDRASHALNDLRSSWQLDDPVLDKDNRAIGEEVYIVVLQFFQAVFKFNCFKTDQNIFIWAERRGSAALIVHQYESIVRRTQRRVEIRLVGV